MEQKKKLELKTVRQVLIALILGVALTVGGFAMGQRVGYMKAKSQTVSLKDVMNKEMGAKNVDFSLFWSVWDKLEQDYLDPKAVDPQKMVYGAIRGMTAALDDPYTVFLPPSENKQSKEDLAGEFSGVGIQLGYSDNTLSVMSPLPDHPAAKAGIKAGDLILHIKDTVKGLDLDTDGMSLPEAVTAIRGKSGTTVTLTIYREGQRDTKEYALVRDMINVPSVEVKFVDKQGKENEGGEYAHLSVSKFGEKTAEEWNKAVGAITNRRGVKGIVLDLRNNPGGFLQRAIDLASEFVREGTVVQQQGKYQTDKFSVNHAGKLIGRPLVVVVNKGSASASEILAGALRDLLSVKLVGEKSFGKGTVQEAEDVGGGAGIHVTVAKWLLPSGKNIHKEGLVPDIEVKEATEEGALDVQLIKAIEQLPQ